MCLKEVDRCYRFRSINNIENVGICDGCIGRCKVTCYSKDVLNFLNCPEEVGADYFNEFKKYTPNSLMIKEQIDEIERLNITPLHIEEPISFYLGYSFGMTFPNFCVFKCHKINEPDFDLTWGMEVHIEFGKIIYNAMKTLNERD